MNNKTFIAKIKWLKPSEGGRQKPVPLFSDKYAPIVSVDGQKDFWGSIWSIVCIPFELVEEYDTLAYVCYLNMQDAPDNLQIGSNIELFEGSKLVATGKIVEEANITL